MKCTFPSSIPSCQRPSGAVPPVLSVANSPAAQLYDNLNGCAGEISLAEMTRHWEQVRDVNCGLRLAGGGGGGEV